MAYRGETNPKKETLKAMQNNPTAGFADGGEAFNPPQGDWEGLKAALMQNQGKPPMDPMEQTGETDPGHMQGIVNSLGGGMALGSMTGLPSALKGLGEAGEISIGRAAPEMEGMGPKIEVFVKGVQKGSKGSPDVKLYGVKGAPEDLLKEFGDKAPGSVPEHILRQKGLLPEQSVDATNMSSPNTYAHGGEVMKGYADGGDVMNQFLQGAPQAAAVPADMDNAQQLGIGGAFTPPPPQPPMDQDFMNKLQAGTAMTPPPPQAPGLSQAMQSAQNMPPTNPSIYQGISADDRAALMQQLLAQKASGGNLAMSGIAGLGDAISNSFGKGGQHAQQDVRQAQAQNVQNQIGVMDTQRQQKTQDMEAMMQQQGNDPNSPLSKSMQQTFKAAGVNVPSGMPANIMMKIAPALGEMAMKQAELMSMNQFRQGELGQKKAELENKQETYQSEHPILNFLNPVGQGMPTSPVSNPHVPAGMPDIGQSFNGEKVVSVKRIK